MIGFVTAAGGGRPAPYSDADLAGIASDLGYADQAHLTRDFRAATGLTPGRFAARFR